MVGKGARLTQGSVLNFGRLVGILDDVGDIGRN